MAREKYYGTVWDYDGTTVGFYRTGLIAVIRMILIAFNVIVVSVPYFTFLLIICPLIWINPAVFWRIEGFMFEHAVLIVSNWQHTAKYTLSTVGEDLRSLVGRRCLISTNHQSTSDIMMFVTMMSQDSNISRHQTSIEDWILKFTPFGWFLLVHGDFFIDQKAREKELGRFASYVQEVFVPRNRKWYFVFPEGGLLWKRKARSQAFARKNGYPVLEHVALPRIGIMEIFLRLLSPKSPDFITLHNHANNNNNKIFTDNNHGLEYLVDLTIGYPERTDLNLQTICLGTRNPCQTQMHVRKFPITDVPIENEALLKWMYCRFEEKELLLDVFYKTGYFPEWDPVKQEVVKDKLLSSPQPIRLSNTKILMTLLCTFALYTSTLNFIWMPLYDFFS